MPDDCSHFPIDHTHLFKHIHWIEQRLDCIERDQKQTNHRLESIGVKLDHIIKLLSQPSALNPSAAHPVPK